MCVCLKASCLSYVSLNIGVQSTALQARPNEASVIRVFSVRTSRPPEHQTAVQLYAEGMLTSQLASTQPHNVKNVALKTPGKDTAERRGQCLFVPAGTMHRRGAQVLGHAAQARRRACRPYKYDLGYK